MYYYWTKKGIRPSVFYSMPKGELLLIKAFFEEELKEKAKLANQGIVCPSIL